MGGNTCHAFHTGDKRPRGLHYLGVYLGLFNGTICVPQIIAAALGGVLLELVGSAQCNMLFVAGVLLMIGAACVFIIKEKNK